MIYGLSIRGNSDDLKWPFKIIPYCMPFKYDFFVQLCSSLQDFDWHSASRSTSAVTELLVILSSVISKFSFITRHWRSKLTEVDFAMCFFIEWIVCARIRRNIYTAYRLLSLLTGQNGCRTSIMRAIDSCSGQCYLGFLLYHRQFSRGPHEIWIADDGHCFCAQPVYGPMRKSSPCVIVARL